MEKLLSDCSKFVKIDFNPKHGNKPGVIYGLCKVHKGTTDNDNVPPFCPVLFCKIVTILKQFKIN